MDYKRVKKDVYFLILKLRWLSLNEDLKTNLQLYIQLKNIIINLLFKIQWYERHVLLSIS